MELKDTFLPFVRSDYYGDCGLRKLSVLETLQLVVFAVALVPLRVAAAVGCMLGYYCICRLLFLLPQRYQTKILVITGKVYTRVFLLALGFLKVQWIRVSHSPSAARPACVVSNHLSWIDILVHMSRYMPSFVARDGTQNLPLVGLISRLMGCLYVKREDKSQTSGIAAQVKARMLEIATSESERQPLLLFPEGTTTNGKYLLPFKRGAFLAGVPVQPVILQYGRGRVSPCWESISAARHILLVMCQPFHSITCYELPVYVPNEAEREDPDLYAKNVRDYMLRYGKLMPSNAVLEDKREYQAALRRKYGIKE